MSENEANPLKTSESKVKPDPGRVDKKITSLFLQFMPLFHPVAKRWLQALAWLVNFIVPSILSILFGFSPLPGSIPLIDAIKKHPIGSLGVCGGLALLTVLSLFASRRSQPTDDAKGLNAPAAEAKDAKKPDQNTYLHIRPWMIVTGLSIASSTVCLALLLVVLVRPLWCPTSLCPGPQIIFNPNGTHDDNLEVYFKTLENTSTVLPGDITHYSQNNIPVNSDPKTIGGVRIDGKVSLFPYRVVVGVHSLQQGRFGLIIERVNLVVSQVSLLPNPLNILTEGGTIDYRANPYLVTYNGQRVGAKLSATYVPDPIASVVLAPGEADQLDIQVNSHVLANLQFQIQVTYRVANESQTYTLTLPFMFQVAFSNTSNWHPYRLENGHLMAGS